MAYHTVNHQPWNCVYGIIIFINKPIKQRLRHMARHVGDLSSRLLFQRALNIKTQIRVQCSVTCGQRESCVSMCSKPLCTPYMVFTHSVRYSCFTCSCINKTLRLLVTVWLTMEEWMIKCVFSDHTALKEHYWSHIHNVLNKLEIWETHLKILHDMNPTTILICKFKNSDKNCSVCSTEPELLPHLFYECSWLWTFWSDVVICCCALRKYPTIKLWRCYFVFRKLR